MEKAIPFYRGHLEQGSCPQLNSIFFTVKSSDPEALLPAQYENWPQISHYK